MINSVAIVGKIPSQNSTQKKIFNNMFERDYMLKNEQIDTLEKSLGQLLSKKYSLIIVNDKIDYFVKVKEKLVPYSKIIFNSINLIRSGTYKLKNGEERRSVNKNSRIFLTYSNLNNEKLDLYQSLDISMMVSRDNFYDNMNNALDNFF